MAWYCMTKNKSFFPLRETEKKQKKKTKAKKNLLDCSAIIFICIITIKYFEKDTVQLVINLILKQSVFGT